MHRRRFLELAGRWSASLGLAAPLVGETVLQGAPDVDGNRHLGSRSSAGTRVAPSLTVLLDREWSISIDPRNVGRKQSWFRTVQPGAKPTRVPSILQESYPGYHGVVWYWLRFTPEAHLYKSGRYLLRFNAVDYLADVWMNGTYLGSHEGGETPFTLDATQAIRPKVENIVAVRVLNPDNEPIDGIVLAETPHRNKVVKFQPGSAYDYGGILEPVELFLTPAIRISDLYLCPDWKAGSLRIQLTTHNSLTRTIRVHFRISIAEKASGRPLLTSELEVTAPPGDKLVNHQITIKNHRLWQLDDPYLYQLTARIGSPEVEGSDEISKAFGFRDFRVENGYFRLNGRRLFLRSTHTGNNVPFGQVVPPPGFPDLLRYDLLNAKTSGFNTVRFISGLAHPYELDICDELGLLVYEESPASWLLKNSPKMKERYENSIREMILRDRNHPSVAIWGMLNETPDGPVFREAESALPLVRSLDQTRLVLLSSGRFDGHLEIGSVSNPGGSQWEPVWGKEGPGAGHVSIVYPSGPGIGDFHLYPTVPQTPEINQMMRTLGHDSKPVFLSEYGIGSMMDVIHEAKMYEQAGIPKDAPDYVLMRSMADRLTTDWSRFGMETTYPDPESLLQASQIAMARHRTLGFNLIRSNPKICGFNLTGMLDHAMTGEGVWRFWRDWKPGAFDAMRDGWAPVRWCLFAEPLHAYLGRPITLEAVLANEDVVQPGDYPAQFRAWGPEGLAWEKQVIVSIPHMAPGEDGPLSVPVLKEEVILHGSEGVYELIPYIGKGIAPPETSWKFYLSDPASLPRVDGKVVTWGVPAKVEAWLTSHGADIVKFKSAAPKDREVILVGKVSTDPSSAALWKDLAACIATGSTVVFLSPLAFQRANEPAAWLPLAHKGRIYEFKDWLYHKECVAKPHAVFAGLQGKGMLDWYYYGPMWPHYLFDGQNTPDEVMAVAFAAGYSTPGGYASGVLLGSYKFGAGRFILNTFPILDHVDSHPVADRLLINLIHHASGSATGPAAPLPSNFSAQLEEIGYAD